MGVILTTYELGWSSNHTLNATPPSGNMTLLIINHDRPWLRYKILVDSDGCPACISKACHSVRTPPCWARAAIAMRPSPMQGALLYTSIAEVWGQVRTVLTTCSHETVYVLGLRLHGRVQKPLRCNPCRSLPAKRQSSRYRGGYAQVAVVTCQCYDSPWGSPGRN